jgi:hypothetical protein
MSETRILRDNLCFSIVGNRVGGGRGCIEVMMYRLDQYGINSDNFFRTHALLLVSVFSGDFEVTQKICYMYAAPLYSISFAI